MSICDWKQKQPNPRIPSIHKHIYIARSCRFWINHQTTCIVLGHILTYLFSLATCPGNNVARAICVTWGISKYSTITRLNMSASCESPTRANDDMFITLAALPYCASPWLSMFWKNAPKSIPIENVNANNGGQLVIPRSVNIVSPRLVKSVWGLVFFNQQLVKKFVCAYDVRMVWKCWCWRWKHHRFLSYMLRRSPLRRSPLGTFYKKHGWAWHAQEELCWDSKYCTRDDDVLWAQHFL